MNVFRIKKNMYFASKKKKTISQKNASLLMFELITTNGEELSVRLKLKRSDRLLLEYIRLKNGQVSTQKDRFPLGPQDAYEVWNEDAKDEARIEKEPESEERADKIPERDNDEDEDYDDDSVKSHLRKLVNEFDTTNSWYKASFIIRSRGLEVLPTYKHYNNSHRGLLKQHVHNLNILLHLNIMKRNWPMAYKIFCLLIRIPKVDIRSIWPLGVQILMEYNKANKDDAFFQWLLSFFSSNKYIYTRDSTRKIHTKSAPAWKSGSKSHAPLFVITSLWNLMSKKDYGKVLESLDELLLEPPYSNEGVFYFLRAICLICRNTEVIKQMESEEENSVRRKIVENNRQIESDLKKCDELKFIYPRAHITDQINVVMDHFDLERRVDSDSEEGELTGFNYEEGEEEDDEEVEIEQKNGTDEEVSDRQPNEAITDRQPDEEELAFDFDID